MKNLVFNLRNAKAQAEGCAKVTKSSRMAKILTTLTLLLSLCVGQIWGDIAYSGGKIYFADIYDVNSGYIQICGRQSKWTGISTMSNIGHTKLYYVLNPQGSGWGGILGWEVISDDEERSNYDFDTWTDCSWYSGWQTYGFNSGSTYLIEPSSSSSNGGVKTSYYSGGYSSLNHDQTVYKYTSSGGTTPASYTAQSVASGTVTISAYKMTGDGTASNTSNSGTISAAATTSLAKGAAYTGEVTLTASANAGYSFVGWFESTSATTAVSTSTSYTYNAPNSTKSIYARFKAEETHDVTVYYKYGSTTVKTETIESAVGVTTERTFTAPVIDGYNFYSYTFGSGLTRKTAENNTNPCRFVTKSTGSYELTVNYNIAPVKLLYGTSTPLNSPSNTDMTYDATSKAYYVDVTTTASPYYFRFDYNNNTQEYAGDWNTYPDVNAVTANGSKVACATKVKGWENSSSLKFTGLSGSTIRIWFSYKDKQAWITETTYTVTITNDGNGTTSPASVTAGKNTLSGSFSATANTGYYFKNWTKTSGSVTITNANVSPTTTKATAASSIRANFNPKWQVLGNGEFGGWTAYGSNLFTGYITEGGKDKGYYSITLSANTTYEIQAYDRQASKLYGGTAVQDVYYNTSGFENPYTLATQSTGKNLYIHTAAGGTYQLEWNLTDKIIAVQYPTSRFIEIGQDIAEAGSVTAIDGESNTIVNGQAISDGGSITFTAATNTGYNFDGWYSNAECTTAYTHNGSTIVINDAAKTLQLTNVSAQLTKVYAKFVPKTYTVTLTQTGAASAGTASVTASYNADAPTIATLPTAAEGYAFMGYYSATDGEGTQFVQANGTWNDVASYISGGKWIRDGGATLYAYFKKAEITDITLNNTMFDPVDAGEGWVIANPTIAPTPAGTTKICWELLYDNDNPVPAGHEAQAYTEGDTKPNQVRFSITGLAAGGYKIKATLRTGDDCSGGTLLSEREVSFTIASGYTVTIQYKDTEGNTIAPSTTSPGKATDWTSISAPTIVGYNFSTWVPGDGITLESSATTNNNRFKATFNGTLTARYTKKRVIYFNNTLGWSNVYVYFYSSNKYWADNYGTGAYAGKYFDGYKPYSDQRHGHMTQIEGTNIWYFDYTAAGYDTYENIAFANMDKSNSGTDNTSNNDLGFFSNTISDPIQVVRRGDHNASLPMFVPLAGQPKTKLNNNKAEYSNQGYWMNYPENTGYALRLFNSSGVEIDSIPFEFTPDKTMPMSVEYILDGSKTYQFKLYRTDGKWFGNNGTMKAGASGDIGETSWEFKEKDGETTRNNCQIKTNAAGTYTFTLDFGNKDGYNYLIGVHYPAAANDFQILYNDNAEWSLGSTHDENWVHPSRIIRARENGVDTISFFVAKNNAPILKARKVSSINASGAITWGSLNISGAAEQDLTVDSSAVYNFKVTQGAAGVINSIEYIGPYTGNYYIRSSALSNKWGNYVDNLDHRMTYSSFSESNANSFGEKYSHYKAKWCPRNTNIAFCIANDYSPCITDTLKQDVGNPYNNTDTEGTLKNDGDAGHSGNNAYLDRYSANVRFMWDRKTNKISRAYISAATSGLAQFLVLRAGQELHNENNVAISSSPANSVLLSDNENWIYEARLMIKPGTRFKLYACYAKSPVDPASAQYFRGAYDSDNFTSDDNSVILIGGESVDYQLARIVYDFKTNRLIAAWMPSGEVSGTNEINADIMVIRDHQESARCITFADASANLSKVKTVYGVMRFNRWILNNRQHPEDQDKEHARPDHIAEDLAEHHPPLSVGQQKSTYERRLYFISFPFDVLVGDIFGFGTYGQYWVIQYYDGLNRAKNGYWMDSKPNWKYVSPTEVAQGYKLEKNQGYILELNLSAMAADNTTFWSNGISTIELYFPSTVNQETLKQTNCTIPALSDEYKCTINRGTTEGDRRVKDSYWRCIGVPSYNLYNSTLKDGSGNDITWKTDYTWQEDESEFPFIYMWNKTDNTLTPQATSAFTFQPMHAYLTQIKNAIVWTAVSAKPSSIVARRANKEATKEYNWRIELKQDTTFLDQTYVRMTDLEQVTDSFDFGQDLIKELNSRSNIYTFIGYEKVAANSMTLHTDQTTVIPVGANITTEGDYTFALPDGADGIGVTLIDAETGTHTNLSAGMDYTVYLEKGTHDNRFWLEISPVQQTPTDIELINGENGDASLNGVRKVLIDGILYIVKDGKLFDARGARVE